MASPGFLTAWGKNTPHKPQPAVALGRGRGTQTRPGLPAPTLHHTTAHLPPRIPHSPVATDSALRVGPRPRAGWLRSGCVISAYGAQATLLPVEGCLEAEQRGTARRAQGRGPGGPQASSPGLSVRAAGSRISPTSKTSAFRPDPGHGEGHGPWQASRGLQSGDKAEAGGKGHAKAEINRSPQSK